MAQKLHTMVIGASRVNGKKLNANPQMHATSKQTSKHAGTWVEIVIHVKGLVKLKPRGTRDNSGRMVQLKPKTLEFDLFNDTHTTAPRANQENTVPNTRRFFPS